MTITFADGTRIDVPASAFDNFLKHDLKWVEFVHGRAEGPFSAKPAPHSTAQQQNAHRCPSAGC